MNSQFHTPSFGDEVFHLGDSSTSSFIGGNSSVNNVNSSHWLQQQQTLNSTKRMVSLHNTSDEYHTANEESFNVTATNNSIIPQNSNTPNNVLPAVVGGGQTGNTTSTGLTTMAARKQMLPLNQNEKPLSAYALFFRDTVSAIKQQNPNCTFQELSKIVASMWEALDQGQKDVYNKKNEVARIEYLNQMRIYQQQQQLKQQEQQKNPNENLQPVTNTTTVTAQVVPPANNINNKQNSNEVITNNVVNTATTTKSTATSVNSSTPADAHLRLLIEAGALQKCVRENCPKGAVVNPDWEDEYCSNECVIMHCRNVFNAWVQSNLEAKQHQQQQ